MKTLDQQLLKHAYDCVSSLSSKSKGVRDKYGAWCHNLPGMIHNSGLAQAAAFLNSKAENARLKSKAENARLKNKVDEAEAYEALVTHLSGTPGAGLTNNLLESMQNSSAASYMLSTRRIQQALPYFKRFAISLLHVDEDAARKERDVEE